MRSQRERLSMLHSLMPQRVVARFSPALSGRAGATLIPFVRGEAWRRSEQNASLGRLGDLEVRLASTASEIRRAQALRYRVFYDEMSAMPDLRMKSTRRDMDRFDRVCDHLIVVDHASRRRTTLGRQPEIVGTYRLLREDSSNSIGGFYSAGEFDVAPLLGRKSELRFLELGRSCVLPRYRDKRTLELLWHGVWAYVLQHRQDVMIGCASLEGTDPDRLALPLSFLHHHARAPEEWRVRAHDHHRVEMDRMSADDIDVKAALRALPPLIKGYLRLGAMIGEGAVVDRQFGTIDVFIVLPVAAIADRYVTHFGANAGRYATKEATARDRPLVAA